MFWIVTQSLLSGLATTFEIFILTLIFALPLGLILAFGLLSKFTPLKRLVQILVWIIRGTPLMLQLMVVYFGPYYLFGMKVTATYRFYAVIIGFALNYAAYFAEIFRSGIQSIERGQYEAAKCLGFSYIQTMRRIIIPQMIKRVLPPISNETITLVKDTSLIYVLAMNDLLRTTRNLVQRDFSITPFLVAGVFYLLMTLVLTYGFDKLEKRFSKYD